VAGVEEGPGPAEQDPPPPRARGAVARLRAHLMDVTPLRESRDFRRLFIGRSISEFGDEIVVVAVPFQVWHITHSVLAVAMLGLCELVPVFVFPIVGGAMADALERRRLIISTNVFLVVMSLLMAFNASLSRPRLWPLYVFATLSAGMYTFNRPALSTWPARLIELELLPSANALDAGFGTAVGMLGPVVAGVLLGIVGATGAFLFDAVTFVVAIGFVWRMAPSPPAPDAPDVGWTAIADGFRFLKGRHNIQSVFAMDFNAMFFGFPVALFPAIADRLSAGTGAGILGLLYAAPAAGAFLATAFSGRAKHVRRQGRAIMVAVVVWGGAITLFGLSHVWWLALLMLAVAGAGDMVSGIFRMSILQTAVDDSMRGRLDGIGMAVWATGPALGNVESGVVASLTSIQVSVVSGGLLCILGVGALRLLVPGFGRYDARDPHA
jgi:MFS family permease